MEESAVYYGAKRSFSPKQKGIVIASLAIALAFMIIGIVILASGDGSSKDPGSTPGVTLTLNSDRSFTCDSNETLTFYYTPTSTGYYYFMFDNSSLVSIVNESGGSPSRESDYTHSSYDTSYRLYLGSGTKYTFKIKTNSSATNVWVKIAKN